MKIKLQIFLLVLLTANLLFPVSLYAQSVYRGTVVRLTGTYEPYYDIKVEPGKSFIGEFTIQHEYEDRNKKVELYVDATDFDFDSETGATIYPEDSYEMNGSYSLASWITFDKDTVTLTQYGEKQSVKFTINVPSNATPGSRYANIIVSNVAEGVVTGQDQLEINTQGAGIASRLVAATVLVTVPGNVTQEISLDSVKVVGFDGDAGLFGFIHEMYPVYVLSTIKNIGNQLLLPGGDVFVHQGDATKPLLNQPLNPERSRILPNKNRTFRHKWDDSIFTKNDNGNFTVNLSKMPRLGYGRYFAEVNFIVRNQNNELQRMTKTVEFWIIPWKLILLILTILIGFGTYKYLKWKGKIGGKTNKGKDKSRSAPTTRKSTSKRLMK